MSENNTVDEERLLWISRIEPEKLYQSLDEIGEYSLSLKFPCNDVSFLDFKERLKMLFVGFLNRKNLHSPCEWLSNKSCRTCRHKNRDQNPCFPCEFLELMAHWQDAIGSFCGDKDCDDSLRVRLIPIYIFICELYSSMMFKLDYSQSNRIELNHYYKEAGIGSVYSIELIETSPIKLVQILCPDKTYPYWYHKLWKINDSIQGSNFASLERDKATAGEVINDVSIDLRNVERLGIENYAVTNAEPFPLGIIEKFMQCHLRLAQPYFGEYLFSASEVFDSEDTCSKRSGSRESNENSKVPRVNPSPFTHSYPLTHSYPRVGLSSYPAPQEENSGNGRVIFEFSESSIDPSLSNINLDGNDKSDPFPPLDMSGAKKAITGDFLKEFESNHTSSKTFSIQGASKQNEDYVAPLLGNDCSQKGISKISEATVETAVVDPLTELLSYDPPYEDFIGTDINYPAAEDTTDVPFVPMQVGDKTLRVFNRRDRERITGNESNGNFFVYRPDGGDGVHDRLRYCISLWGRWHDFGEVELVEYRNESQTTTRRELKNILEDDNFVTVAISPNHLRKALELFAGKGKANEAPIPVWYWVWFNVCVPLDKKYGTAWRASDEKKNKTYLIITSIMKIILLDFSENDPMCGLVEVSPLRSLTPIERMKLFMSVYNIDGRSRSWGTFQSRVRPMMALKELEKKYKESTEMSEPIRFSRSVTSFREV